MQGHKVTMLGTGLIGTVQTRTRGWDAAGAGAKNHEVLVIHPGYLAHELVGVGLGLLLPAPLVDPTVVS